MEVLLHEISIKNRVRKDLGNLSQLMESMKKHGLLNPIIITENNELIAGHRRLEAAKKLGWYQIEVKIYSNLSRADRLELELDENVYRKEFNPDELTEGYTRLNHLKNPGFWRRFLDRILSFFIKLFRLH